ncbi:layilin isoform X1 [Takifugu flavidus]|uniref:layilin isoform X1 n=1 Tax=Takifugu flavidus TaxID=433684 RepID=UPI002544BF92|nr:layilin isoform X1 [Takifugu flavidus]
MREKTMDLCALSFCLLCLCFDASAATSLITANIFETKGQRVCRAGRGKPCYKLAYFSELRRKLNFKEADLACRRDGGQLLSVESASEQKLVEQLITELRPTDGDFWIGLRRNQAEVDSSLDCAKQYYWTDGSKSTFRNWHWDEPSCGYEVCVVMYHQPSAPPSMGGLYMFQWNDDNCETKNNFICKYTAETLADTSPPPDSNQTNILPSAVFPSDHKHDKSRAPNIIYIIIPSIPLILLLMTVTGVCCFKMLSTRRKKEHKPEASPPEPAPSRAATPTDIYNVIRSQNDDDLVSARPHTKNTSFLCSSPDTPTGDYDNLGGRDTESGFVTLASTESCFLNFDLNDFTLGRRGTFQDTSLGRSGKREVDGGGLGYGLYDRSLGRRTTKSEHYGSSFHGGDGGIGRGSDLQPGGQAMKADLYQTYTTNGKGDAYQTCLANHGTRNPYEANVGCYRSGLTLDGRGRYFNEQEWMNRDNY